MRYRSTREEGRRFRWQTVAELHQNAAGSGLRESARSTESEAEPSVHHYRHTIDHRGSIEQPLQLVANQVIRFSLSGRATIKLRCARRATDPQAHRYARRCGNTPPLGIVDRPRGETDSSRRGAKKALALSRMESCDCDSCRRDITVKSGRLSSCHSPGLDAGICHAGDSDERSEKCEDECEWRSGERPDQHRPDHRCDHRDDRKAVRTGDLGYSRNCYRVRARRRSLGGRCARGRGREWERDRSSGG